LYLVRHGQVDGYEKFPIYGHTDAALTEVGILHFQQLADRLRFAKIQAIYCSDLQRAVVGARIIAQNHDVPIHVCPEFRELHFGDWEGLGLQDVRERFPAHIQARMKDPVSFRAPGDGETVGELSERVMACFRRILKNHEDQDFLIVGHGAVNRVILCDALGLPLQNMFRLHQDYGCLNLVDYFPDSTVVRLVNG